MPTNDQLISHGGHAVIESSNGSHAATCQRNASIQSEHNRWLAGCVRTNMGCTAHLSIVFYTSSKKHGLGSRKVAAVRDGGGKSVENEVSIGIFGSVGDALELEEARMLLWLLGL